MTLIPGLFETWYYLLGHIFPKLYHRAYVLIEIQGTKNNLSFEIHVVPW